MAFQPVVDCVEIDMIFTQQGEITQNVFYAKLPNGYVLADLLALAGVIDAQWQGTWRPQQVSEVTYVRTEVRGLAVQNDLLVTDGSSTNPGGHAGAALPNSVTFCLKKESGLTGRSARGRTYWIGVPRSELEPLDDNQLQSAYVASVQAAVDSIRTAINGVGLWEAVLVSRFTGGAPRTAGYAFPWLSTTWVDFRVDTQRNRLPSG